MAMSNKIIQFKYLQLLVVIAIHLTHVSCDNFLDKQPVTALSSSQFFKTAEDANAAVAGMYDALQSALIPNYFYWGEVRSDNVMGAASSGDKVLLGNAITATHNTANWSDLYKTISNANFILKYVPKILPVSSAAVIDNQLGQAYTTRALMYFYAIRVWGRVPLITEPYEQLPGQKMYNPRASVDAVKSQIISDLENAISLFGTTSVSSPYYFNAGSARAIKMDVHLWFKEYEKALLESDAIIEIKKYALATNDTEWKSIFLTPTASNEPIFTIYWDYVKDGSHTMALNFGTADRSTQYKMRNEVWDTLLLRKTDKRLAMMIDTLEYRYTSAISFATLTPASYDVIAAPKMCKYLAWDLTKNTSRPVPGAYTAPVLIEYNLQVSLYRYAGLMLLRAEALANIGGDENMQAARDIVNAVRSRMGYLLKSTSANTPDKASLIKTILTERRIELWGEGIRWFDLVRNDMVTTTMDPILNPSGFGNLDKILWPLHTNVFEANPLLRGDQNPGYTQN